jgi:protocatechuate 3,4-dioxygenase, beta subunit
MPASQRDRVAAGKLTLGIAECYDAADNSSTFQRLILMASRLLTRVHEELARPEFANLSPSTRRQFLRHLSFGAAMLGCAGAFADELIQTPGMTEGPFYPDKLPLDTDNDLLIVNDRVTPGVGEITHLSGRVLTTGGEPVRNAFVEIWQCDINGSYLHAGSSNREKYDNNFQGYGRFLTDAKGHYYFRTIKPVPYPGRTPHIHFAVSQNGQRLLTTQLLIKGEPQNESDGVFRQIRDPKLRELVMADFKPIASSKLGELSADFDLVLGRTPHESEDGRILGGISQPLRG